MGILSRFGEIMSANLGALLDRAEGKNAEKLLDEYLRKAQSDLGQLKAEAAASAAWERAARRELDELDAQIEKYGRYARGAVEQGQEADARKFLAAQVELQQKRPAAAARASQAEEDGRKMRELAQKLNGDMDLIAARLRGLKGQIAAVRQQEKMNSLQGGALSQFDRIEEEIQRRQDKADAMAELQKGEDGALEDLKRKYGGSPAPAASGDPVEEALRKLREETGT